MQRSTLAVAVLLLGIATTAQAQDKFSLDFRGGASFATADLGDATLKPGGGFGATASMAIMPHLRIYGGWDRTQFVTDDPFAGRKYEVVPNGYAFGLQFQHPLRNSAFGWVRAGGLYNHVELEDDDTGDTVDNDHELGWEVAGGLRLPIGQRLALTPGVRYRAFSADLELPSGPVTVDMNFISAEIGISWSFGVSSVAALVK